MKAKYFNLGQLKNAINTNGMPPRKVDIATSKVGNLTKQRKAVVVKIKQPSKIEEMKNIAKLKLGLINTLPIYTPEGKVYLYMNDGIPTIHSLLGVSPGLAESAIQRVQALFTYANLEKLAK